MKFAFVEEQKVAFPVKHLCDAMGVSRSGYYAWRREQPSERTVEDARLVVEIRKVHDSSRQTYGVRRVAHELQCQGRKIGLRRVRRLMRGEGLLPRSKRRFRATTDSRHTHPVADNLLARQFEVGSPNQVWAGDITYIPTDEGWLYLATLVDLYSRRIVGWAMSERIDRQLTLTALQRAIKSRQPQPGLLHHTDRGSQYACSDYQQALADRGIKCSMSRKGDCWDNAVAESTFATIKAELVHWENFKTRQQARESISKYIDDFYNLVRRHSTLEYLSPVEFELANEARVMAA